MRISAIDLFCGAGGLTHGLILEGISVIAGIDIDPLCRFPFEQNNHCPFIEKDLRDLETNEIERLFPEDHIKVLAGCAPCQPFSTYTQGRDNQEENWGLLYSFSDIARDILPDVITMENVPQLTKHQVYKNFIRRLERYGYIVSAHKVFCPDYGVPQNRTRLVFFASLFGPVELIRPTHKKYRTVRQTIGHLETIAAGEVSINDPLHRASGMNTINQLRIRASNPGGTWKEWDKKLRSKCHNRKSGKSYPSIYGRMEWDKPAPTITTLFHGFGNGRFGHPQQNRALSLREGALLQTFPRSYKFIEPNTKANLSGLGRLIGNAIPVRLGRIVGRSIKKHLELHYASQQ